MFCQLLRANWAITNWQFILPSGQIYLSKTGAHSTEVWKLKHPENWYTANALVKRGGKIEGKKNKRTKRGKIENNRSNSRDNKKKNNEKGKEEI